FGGVVFRLPPPHTPAYLGRDFRRGVQRKPCAASHLGGPAYLCSPQATHPTSALAQVTAVHGPGSLHPHSQPSPCPPSSGFRQYTEEASCPAAKLPQIPQQTFHWSPGVGQRSRWPKGILL
ncbi:unnamed protein product, partial [Ectocarpus sp. 12 AP-2014]